MALKSVEHAAAPKHLLTLDEVAAWVQDAMRSGASGTETVAARVSFGGKLQKIGIVIDTATGAEATPPTM
ncbi:hypothetical protein [Streptomyces corynorhini]|uniref:Uncharacterized protein n=1 Tax=Streptomyces corynorhini TaxID=2282652 RepID=A0A370BE04_9ACTN|nr:hypothetical protein [Streptomyces corynorhini]RDG37946.1 hypothetical protein DVH02_11525 [Streptomyces corynorhini]